jgi:hypothetical protein
MTGRWLCESHYSTHPFTQTVFRLTIDTRFTVDNIRSKRPSSAIGRSSSSVFAIWCTVSAESRQVHQSSTLPISLPSKLTESFLRSSSSS